MLITKLDIDPLENDLNKRFRGSQNCMTPTLESHKYFTIVVRHRTQADGTGILQNEVTAIEFRSSMSPEVKRNPDIHPFENDLNRHRFEAGRARPRPLNAANTSP
jgi:hypothetical protein